jgi:hypothetical protein
MPKLTWAQATAWHVRRQHLDSRLPRPKLLQLTSELCGLHAQVMSSAELTAWRRIEGLRRSDIAKAVWQDRKLIKTWAMRRTLHLLPASGSKGSSAVWFFRRGVSSTVQPESRTGRRVSQ